MGGSSIDDSTGRPMEAVVQSSGRALSPVWFGHSGVLLYPSSQARRRFEVVASTSTVSSRCAEPS